MVPVRIGPSRIHGKGLFAASSITVGTRILPYTGERISRAEGQRRLAQGNVYIFHLNARYDIDGSPFTGSVLR